MKSLKLMSWLCLQLLMQVILTLHGDFWKLFQGYATTAAAQEGHHHLLGLLLKAGASQPACEDALLEACRYGQAKAIELLISSEMIRYDVAAHALVYASCRGFVDIVSILIKNGVDQCQTYIACSNPRATV